jgi:hypothetical protein
MPLTGKSQADSGNGDILDDDIAASIWLLTNLLAVEGCKVSLPPFRYAVFSLTSD